MRHPIPKCVAVSISFDNNHKKLVHWLLFPLLLFWYQEAFVHTPLLGQTLSTCGWNQGVGSLRPRSCCSLVVVFVAMGNSAFDYSVRSNNVNVDSPIAYSAFMDRTDSK